MTDTSPPRLERPSYHVWLTPADDLEAEPAYHGVVTVLNVDQLTAETQAKGLGIKRDQPFHLTNLWIWAAMVRTEATQDKFGPFTRRMEYRPVKDDDDQAEEAVADPTPGAPGPSTV